MKLWFFLMLKVVMAKGRKLKKGGGDLEAQKQNVASVESTIGTWGAKFCSIKIKT
jgi:hypothetical protein